MSLRDRYEDAARESMQKTDPECPKCKSKGAWSYTTPDLLNKYDSKTGATSMCLLIAIPARSANTKWSPLKVKD